MCVFVELLYIKDALEQNKQFDLYIYCKYYDWSFDWFLILAPMKYIEFKGISLDSSASGYSLSMLSSPGTFLALDNSNTEAERRAGQDVILGSRDDDGATGDDGRRVRDDSTDDNV